MTPNFPKNFKSFDDFVSAVVALAIERSKKLQICTDMLYREEFETVDAAVESVILDTEYWDGDLFQ